MNNMGRAFQAEGTTAYEKILRQERVGCVLSEYERTGRGARGRK